MSVDDFDPGNPPPPTAPLAARVRWMTQLQLFRFARPGLIGVQKAPTPEGEALQALLHGDAVTYDEED